MNLKKLYEFQNKLDRQIQSRADLQGKALVSHKILALQVKMGELASETQCFKFWLAKKSSLKRKVLEKYIEALYLTLSIGIEKGFTKTEFPVKENECELTDQFLNLFIDTNDYMVCSSEDHYFTLIEDLLSLGLSLGFTEEDIVDTNSRVYTA